jgi:hypothetical protein
MAASGNLDAGPTPACGTHTIECDPGLSFDSVDSFFDGAVELARAAGASSIGRGR